MGFAAGIGFDGALVEVFVLLSVGLTGVIALLGFIGLDDFLGMTFTPF
jgi:hypothetical protein